MPSDNVRLDQNNTNGAVMRTLADSTNTEWAVSVPAYATTVTNGANVLQVVTDVLGLPVTVLDSIGAGTAGDPSTDVLTVQGISGMTPLDVNATVTGTVNASIVGTTSISGNTNATIVGTVPVNATQITSPWVVTGNTNATISGTVPVNATQITSPWVVIGNTNSTIVGTVAVNATQITSPWIVNGNTNATILGTVPVNATQITSPWIVNGNMNATVLGTVPVNATQITSPWIVNGNTNATLLAGTALVGRVSASAETSTVYNGTTAVTPAFATFVVNTNTTVTVVAGTANTAIRVLRWSAHFNGNASIYWQSNSNSVQISGISYGTQFASSGGAYCPVGIFQCASGDSLQLISSVNTNGICSGELTYIKV